MRGRDCVAAACGAALVGALVATHAAAQSYPDHPIRMLVGFPPGGGADVAARIITPNLAENLGYQVVIDNRAGATGTIAAGLLAKAPPDGYTLMMGHMATLTIVPHVYAKLPYDPVNDFTPVTMAGAFPHMMSVHPSLPAKTVREFIALAKSQPGKLTFPSGGSGSSQHLAGEMFKTMAGVSLLHVPYKGVPDALRDLLAGEHAVSFESMGVVTPFVKTGKLRAVAVTTKTRAAAFPDVPTIDEAGVRGYEIRTWYGVFAPAATPPALVRRLHGEIAKVLQLPAVREKLTGLGADSTVTSSPEEFSAVFKSDLARFASVVKAAGVHID
jgi:tripartite-type tricarboxylate transporter receptor subunit TctC